MRLRLATLAVLVLSRAREPSEQQAALAAYAIALGRVEARMRLLEPPPVLVATHRGQLLRVDRARSLSRRLRAAVGRRDAPAITRLLVRFGAVNDVGAVSLAVQRAAVRAYQQRLRDVSAASAAASRELARLQRTLK